jgi:hypothetical protein
MVGRGWATYVVHLMYGLGVAALILAWPLYPLRDRVVTVGMILCGYMLLLVWSVIQFFLANSSRDLAMALVACALLFVSGFWVGRGAPPGMGLPSCAVAMAWLAGCVLLLSVAVVASVRRLKMNCKKRR